MATKTDVRKRVKEDRRLRRIMKKEEQFLRSLENERTLHTQNYSEIDAHDYFVENEIQRQNWA